jgi:hypothetical protein
VSKTFWLMIAAYVVCVFALTTLIYSFLTSAADSIEQSGGLRPSIERLWCGKANCMAEERK